MWCRFLVTNIMEASYYCKMLVPVYCVTWHHILRIVMLFSLHWEPQISQQILCLFLNLQVNYCSYDCTTGPYPGIVDSNLMPSTLILSVASSVLSVPLCFDLLAGCSLWICWQNFGVYFFTCMLHALPILFVFNCPCTIRWRVQLEKVLIILPILLLPVL